MSCYNCKAMSTTAHYSLNGFTIFICKTCRFAKVYPTPDEPTLTRYYSGEETNIAKGNVLNEITAFLDNPQQAIDILREQRLSPLAFLGDQFHNHQATILDVGCGGGTFLASLKHLGYKNVFGLEYNPDSVRLIRDNLGITVFHGTIQAVPSIPLADIATCFDVLEHVPDPQLSLNQLNHMVTPGGGLHIRVPNFNSLSSKLLGRRWLWAIPPYHLNYFEPSVLSGMIKQAGFEIVRVFTTSSGYRLAFLILQLKKLLSNSIDLSSPRSRAFLQRELLAINVSETLLRIIQSPVSRFCQLMNMDECIHIVARKMRAC